jgi:hypothetical protein
MPVKYIIETVESYEVGNCKPKAYEFKTIEDLAAYYDCTVGAIYNRIKNERKHKDDTLFHKDVIKKIKVPKEKRKKVNYWPVCIKCYNKIDDNTPPCCPYS